MIIIIMIFIYTALFKINVTMGFIEATKYTSSHKLKTFPNRSFKTRKKKQKKPKTKQERLISQFVKFV